MRNRPLTRQQMEALTTRRLLAYRNALLGVPEHYGDSDAKELEERYGLVKESPVWKRAYATCLAILKTREHVAHKQKNKR